MTPKTGQPDPTPHPKLLMAQKEIEEILTKYDLAGVALLIYENQAQTIAKIDPSWSVVKLDEARRLQITPPIRDLQDPGKAKKKIADTINLLANLRVRLHPLTTVLAQAELAVRGRFGMSQKPQKENNGFHFPSKK